MSTYFDGPVWGYFGLSYAAYMVLPRSLLCGMDESWQERFVALMKEADAAYDLPEADYSVNLRVNGRFKRDPMANYRYPPALPYRTTGTASSGA